MRRSCVFVSIPSRRSRSSFPKSPSAGFAWWRTRSTAPTNGCSNSPVSPPPSRLRCCSSTRWPSDHLAAEALAAGLIRPMRAPRTIPSEAGVDTGRSQRAHRRQPAVRAQVLAILSHRVPRPGQRVAQPICRRCDSFPRTDNGQLPSVSPSAISRAAALAVRQARPARIVVAVPVAAAQTCEEVHELMAQTAEHVAGPA